MRETAILLLTADLCLSELGLPFELHVGMSLSQAGLTVEDVREVLRHVAPDAGFKSLAGPHCSRLASFDSPQVDGACP